MQWLWSWASITYIYLSRSALSAQDLSIQKSMEYSSNVNNFLTNGGIETLGSIPRHPGFSFVGANKFVINGDINANDRGSWQNTRIFENLLNSACPHAGYRSAERADPPRCHPDTRKETIKEIMDWIDSPDTDSKPIMWFNGSPGVGKSAISQTIAERCSQEGKLLSSFFFSRNASGSGRDDGRKLIPTIAYQLAIEVPAARDIILAELDRDPAVFENSMEDQLKQLVTDPMAKIKSSNEDPSVPTVVIIDGLDECSGTSIQTEIITTIAGWASKSCPESLSRTQNVKFLITSRPEPAIGNAFSAYSRSTVKTIVDNGSIENIEFYLNSRFRDEEEETEGTFSSDDLSHVNGYFNNSHHFVISGATFSDNSVSVQINDGNLQYLSAGGITGGIIGWIIKAHTEKQPIAVTGRTNTIEVKIQENGARTIQIPSHCDKDVHIEISPDGEISLKLLGNSDLKPADSVDAPRLTNDSEYKFKAEIDLAAPSIYATGLRSFSFIPYARRSRKFMSAWSLVIMGIVFATTTLQYSSSL